ncbi:hypothetical protein C4564_06275 [Candidatus Microgenomates bacterium]|nr:MAG: hypothetical protein C4564_06275 [Candidatus Microgenomates bacterium]
MKTRFVMYLVGAIVIVIIGYRFLVTDRTPKIGDGASTTNEAVLDLENKLGIEIEDDASKIELKPVSGVTGSAIASAVEKESGVLLSVLADLPEPFEAEKYSVVLSDPDEEIGEMAAVKGGWILEKIINRPSEQIKKVGILITSGNTKMVIFEGEF